MMAFVQLVRACLICLAAGSEHADPEPLHLTYFPVMAKGLAPALALEVSGLKWEGAHPKDWPAEKSGTPFGQLPTLQIPGGITIAQMIAIMNYVGRVKPKMAGADDREFATSQMLLAFADTDLYPGMQKFQDTTSVKDKCPMSDTDKWWKETVPAMMANLNKLLAARGNGIDKFTSSGMTVGELALFSMLHQMKLVKPALLADAPSVLSFYNRIARAKGVRKVLASGGGFPGALLQYFVERTTDRSDL